MLADVPAALCEQPSMDSTIAGKKRGFRKVSGNSKPRMVHKEARRESRVHLIVPVAVN